MVRIHVSRRAMRRRRALRCTSILAMSPHPLEYGWEEPNDFDFFRGDTTPKGREAGQFLPMVAPWRSLGAATQIAPPWPFSSTKDEAAEASWVRTSLDPASATAATAGLPTKTVAGLFG
jgi:hypothetical protein